MTEPQELEEERYGPVTVLYGERRGKYPHGNSLLVEGTNRSVILDASLGLVARQAVLPKVDFLLFAHCHEDHIAGAHLFPDVPWHFHELDAPGIRSLDDMMKIYGFGGETEKHFREAVRDRFHFVAREEPETFRDGDRYDLGGGVSIEAVHTPGHTRGHCCFHVRWPGPDGDAGLLYLSDIDLSSFGPYYGDAWSDLGDFERSLARVREIEARWYATFHHVGVLEREAYLDRLARFSAVIGSREQRLVEYLAEPHTLDEIVAHRFVYRPTDPVPFADPVERRSMSQHLVRLVDSGRVRETSPGRYRAG